MKQTIEEINDKIKNGTVNVITSHELCDLVRQGEKGSIKEVDIVTTATSGVMSGTYALLNFKVTERAVFNRASKVWLNGIEAYPGPCPNENLGVIDVIVYGTNHSITDLNYGGGHLFHDIVSKKKINVILETNKKEKIESNTSLDQMSTAKIFSTRNSFKNYMAFINQSTDSVDKTIFHARKFKGNSKELTISGCGEINPLKNDPELEYIGVGTRILVNGAIGIVLGGGTRATPEMPNLSTMADMHEMNPRYLGGFKTSMGAEVIQSLAIPIPILDEKMLAPILQIDSKTKLKIGDVHDRVPIFSSNYDNVWTNTSYKIEFHPEICKTHDIETCPIEKLCPTNAFDRSKLIIDRDKCVNCGICSIDCPKKAFTGDLGNIDLGGKQVPIVLRQSNRLLAQELATTLKKMILEKMFYISKKVLDISFK